jgi:aerobic carbon-monoxide dehydrogenase small subunit
MTSPDGVDVSLKVNGDVRLARVEPRRTLADVLRDDLRLTGTHVSCEVGSCGACTILLDGEPARSCLLLAVQVDGREVTTVEGLTEGDELSPLQTAFWDEHATQCGFCTPGMLMLASWLLATDPAPSEGRVRDVLSSNLCRCTGYEDIIRAVLRAVTPPADTRSEV